MSNAFPVLSKEQMFSGKTILEKLLSNAPQALLLTKEVSKEMSFTLRKAIITNCFLQIIFYTKGFF